jgi:uncharacterized protein (DUF362 family)
MVAASRSHGEQVKPGAALSYEISRRHFLAGLAVPLAGIACSKPPYDRAGFVVPVQSSVGLFAAASYGVDFADIIFRGLKELGISLAGRRVFLKPNMVEYELGSVINTHALVVAGAAVACRRAGATEVVVGEGPGHRRDIEYLLSSTGLGDHLGDERIRFVDLNHDDVRVVPLKSWFTGMRQLALPVALLQSDFIISMPKLKTHHWAGMTCSMKNLFGTVPGAVYGWPKNILHMHGIPNSIIDLAATIRPHFAIVDAVTAMEGDGPILGRPRDLGFVAMGSDLVAVDATCARVIGLEPGRMPYLGSASRFLGVLDASRIVHRGEVPARYATRFDVVPTQRHLWAPA